MTLQVFISYKSEYRDFAREVKNELNTWGFETWLDVDNIQPGEYFRHKIQQGLDSSDVLLMVLTEEAQLSREVMAEVDYFLDVAKKPVVPLRHRECKPLYIFVAIQYIDFVADQANGFVHLKQRLNELAQTAVTPASEARPEPIAELDLKPGAAVIDDVIITEKEKKEAVLDDFIGGATADEAPKPHSPPPQSIEQQAPAFGSAPASPIVQPQRQAEYMPMPAATRAKSSRSLLWPLAAVASLVIVVGVVVLLNSNANVSLATEPAQGTSPLVWVVAVAVVGVAGVWGWWRFGRSTATSSPTDDAANRATMLQNVEDFWLKGVLNPALEAGTLDIGLSSAPGAVLRHKDYGDYELPPNANILDVFNDMNRELLILGAPGGGKTVLLLQLARALIGQARQDDKKPIPVVFNLSSWAAERKPLAAWLVDELRQKYQVPKKQATAWVEGEKLLLLLDGLDEVAEQYRNECVDAINAYRQQYRTVDVAVCSRNEEYDSLTSKLDVRGAIVLEPLNQPIIEKYLDRPELASLRQVMATDKELQDMSQVPFLLNAMAYAYAGATQNNLQFPMNDDRVKARRTQLFDRWVEKRLQAKPSAEYTPSKVRKWLGWLGEKIVWSRKNIFYIEELQPQWLDLRQRIYRIWVSLAVGLVFGLTVGLAVGLAVGLVFGLTVGLAVGLAGGLVFGLTVGLVFGQGDIKLTETLRWQLNWTGLTFGSVFGLTFGLVFGLTVGLTAGLGFGLAAGLGFGLAFELAFGLQTGESIVSRIHANQGIRQTAYNTLRVILAGGLAGGLAIGLVFGLVFGLAGGLGVGLTVGLAGGLGVGLSGGGGEAVLKHIILRLFIWRSSYAPWNYAQFLDYCASAGIMRKVGGGYIFAHRYLLEYFAENYVEVRK